MQKRMKIATMRCERLSTSSSSRRVNAHPTWGEREKRGERERENVWHV